ncbi:MAG: glycosyltransferase [Phycisphaerae bacterium]|jgi:glycosyltransferase involved in cell wall biosynthesis
MSHKVAVLLCAYNAEKYLAEAIESILAQSFKDFEFIIVENGSTDKTWEIIQSYKDGRIKSFQTPIKQLSFNLNFGMIQTDAEYIARMDSDDIARPSRLQKQVEFLSANPDVCVLGSAFEKFGDSLGQHKIVLMPQTNEKIRKKIAFRFCLCHPTVMFRRQTIVDAGGYQGGRYCQDVDLWLRLSRDREIKFANLSDVLLDYRIHIAQAKGSRESFVMNSIQLLREAMIQKSFRFFAGFILSLFKILLKAEK